MPATRAKGTMSNTHPRHPNGRLVQPASGEERMPVNDMGVLRSLRVGDFLYRSPPSWKRQDVAEEWSRFKIVGDTMGTWILKNMATESGETINKKTMRTKKDRQGYADVFYTGIGMANKIFCDKHARNIGTFVGSLQDRNLLRQIALMIGYDLKD